MLENMGFRVVDEQTYHVAAGDAGRSRHLVARHDAGARRRRRRPSSSDCKRALEACFIVVMRGVAENDGYNALVLAAGLAWRDVALIRTISRFLRQIRVPYSQDYMWATLRKHAGARDQDRRAVPRALRSARQATADARRARGGDRRRDRGGAGRRSTASTRTASCGTSSTRCSRRSAPTSISSTRTACRSRRSRSSSPAASSTACRCRAALRNLRLFAARRRRAHALRQGGARRHPLVRPAAGFPHRNPRPGEGAAGQERGDRAGRLQGRLRAEAAAGRRHARGDRRPKASRPTSCSSQSLLDITDNLDLKGVVPPRQRGAARRRRSVSRGRRRQGHRDLLRHRQRASRSEHGFWLGDAFASGGSAGYDHKGMGITARGAWEAVKRHFREMDIDITHDAVHRGRRRRHVGRRVRQRHAARDDDEAASPRSTTATSSSIPIPIRKRALPSASACSRCRARAGRTTTRR